jgi:hypothetical protein
MGRSGRGVGDVHQEYSETIVMNNHLHSTEGQRKHPAAITRDQTASQVRLLHASSARSSGGWLVTPPARARLGQGKIKGLSQRAASPSCAFTSQMA